MKLDPSLSLREMIDLLREGLSSRFGCEIGQINIISYRKPAIIIHDNDLVEGKEFKHRAGEE